MKDPLLSKQSTFWYRKNKSRMSLVYLCTICSTNNKWSVLTKAIYQQRYKTSVRWYHLSTEIYGNCCTGSQVNDHHASLICMQWHSWKLNWKWSRNYKCLWFPFFKPKILKFLFFWLKKCFGSCRDTIFLTKNNQVFVNDEKKTN